MLHAIGLGTLDELIEAAVPSSIRTAAALTLPAARSEEGVLAELAHIAATNRTCVQMIGLGYYDTITPPVLRRNMLESPAWYTSYTPYQPEISQGRLEALLTFQTMVADLTGLPVAGASLLDEATAVVEAILLMRRASKDSGSAAVVLDTECFPQTAAVVAGRAAALGIEVIRADVGVGLPDGDFFGVVMQNPGASGVVRDLTAVVADAQERGALVAVATDLLASTLFAPPGDQGADIAVGSAQRFGVPLFYGGPHAGFMSVRHGLERMLPGRLVGVSRDRDGTPAYRLALQTREQHIRRDKATSNICTAQALLANVAGMYAAYHGPDGLASIARRVHGHAAAIATGLATLGLAVTNADYFDTLTVRVGHGAKKIVARAAADGINLRRIDAAHVGISCDERTTEDVVSRVLAAFGARPVPSSPADLPAHLARTSPYLQHEVFHLYRSETAMMRFLRTLSDKDLALDRTMIPLGSCTMKLNAAVEMEPISWPGFAGIHPFAPSEQTRGYRRLVEELQHWLAEITGYDRVSLQPNAGSQGELAGLLAIRGYHQSRGDVDRTICLIPQSAHGTNAASAVLAGMQVVVVATAQTGNIDLTDLADKLAIHDERIAAIMITYPSTHGVYEPDVRQVCDLVHEAGGQVYIDGANLNALVGLARPGDFGGDVSHLNLHKTFCIPHGGGGPGVGPVAARAHLAPFLPSDPLAGDGPVGPVSAANYGSAGILPITWAYLALMGPDGLRAATETAVLSANYLARRLDPYFPVLYTGPGGFVAHECILDLRALTKATGVTAEDVAKRLIDYGFHAPTLSFPVNGTLMVEPTESEGLGELDRFIDAMIAISAEIAEVATGRWELERSPLRQAPHTSEQICADDWDLPYSRRRAAYPVPPPGGVKYWPPVRRIDGAYGDRNLACSCPPPEAFVSTTPIEDGVLV
ncbi:glycine dehydrogenase (decarboxylating) [Mycolicibacterium helvum]|uniref:Glycine dehydrogenase (decarboxylating) n=2 Tax=Mycolicibacterium helvum TaxID=1534349 RepID=A0A7I7TB27_9MYCO|nr:aminomethyl-transferring glycine dehydrogenase [Mycolicibacterium helvum]BBY65545.1 glycine dehydrogenase (decarboxylating) [Mycolicibacterium helvum]